MSDAPRILPPQLIQDVELFAVQEFDDARKYINREVLDESGMWSLLGLAARIYAAGYNDGALASATAFAAIRQVDRGRAEHDTPTKEETR